MVQYVVKRFAGSLAAIALALPGFAAGPGTVLRSSTQLIVVTTADWNAVDGHLQMYRRTPRSRAWKPDGTPVPIVVGKAGMAWGIGAVSMDSVRSPGDPVKREGDHRSPAGIFHFGEAFGYATSEPAGWKVHYLPLKTSTDCVDDPQSRYYNRVLDSTTVSVDWKSAEHMRDAGEAYRWGLVIDHNADPPRPYGGSCVFMHIWSGSGNGTEGCTAMTEANLLAILGGLNPSDHPLLVQMPIEQYRHLAKRFALPATPTTIPR